MKHFACLLLVTMVLLFMAAPVLACDGCRDGPGLMYQLDDATLDQILDTAANATDEALLLNTNQESFTLDPVTITGFVPALAATLNDHTREVDQRSRHVAMAHTPLCKAEINAARNGTVAANHNQRVPSPET